MTTDPTAPVPTPEDGIEGALGNRCGWSKEEHARTVAAELAALGEGGVSIPVTTARCTCPDEYAPELGCPWHGGDTDVRERFARDQRRYDALAETLHKAVLRAERAEAALASRAPVADGGLRDRVSALADGWERTNRMPSGAHDQIQAGVWAATKHDIAELRALLASTEGTDEGTR